MDKQEALRAWEQQIADAAKERELVCCVMEIGIQNGAVSSVKTSITNEVAVLSLRHPRIDPAAWRADFFGRVDRLLARGFFGVIRATWTVSGDVLTRPDWCITRTSKPVVAKS